MELPKNKKGENNGYGYNLRFDNHFNRPGWSGPQTRPGSTGGNRCSGCAIFAAVALKQTNVCALYVGWEWLQAR
jgi:hypothetical protein